MINRAFVVEGTRGFFYIGFKNEERRYSSYDSFRKSSTAEARAKLYNEMFECLGDVTRVAIQIYTAEKLMHFTVVGDRSYQWPVKFAKQERLDREIWKLHIIFKGLGILIKMRYFD